MFLYKQYTSNFKLINNLEPSGIETNPSGQKNKVRYKKRISRHLDPDILYI